MYASGNTGKTEQIKTHNKTVIQLSCWHNTQSPCMGHVKKTQAVYRQMLAKNLPTCRSRAQAQRVTSDTFLEKDKDYSWVLRPYAGIYILTCVWMNGFFPPPSCSPYSTRHSRISEYISIEWGHKKQLFQQTNDTFTVHVITQSDLHGQTTTPTPQSQHTQETLQNQTLP